MTRSAETLPLAWEGPATVEAARRQMLRGHDVEIALPIGMHHALYARLHPRARWGAVEDLDASGGPELLLRIAMVAGLEELRRLQGPARRMRYSVRLSGPDPVLTLAAPGARTGASDRGSVGW